MTNDKLDEMRSAIASAQLIELSPEIYDEKRIRQIYNALFEAIEHVKILQDDELAAIEEADETLVAHVNRRL